MADGWVFLGEIGKSVFQLGQQLAELSASIAEVMDMDHIVTEKLKQPTNADANGGRSEMASVHLFRTVFRMAVATSRGLKNLAMVLGHLEKDMAL